MTPAAPARSEPITAENPAYLSDQLITYLGNKRALLDFIGQAVERITHRLGRTKLRIFDAFAGSGVVSRYFKRFATTLVACDLERYAEITNQCYLANVSDLDLPQLRAAHEAVLAQLEDEFLKPGFIAELYAPQDEAKIRLGERVFYTPRNARYLDTARQLIAQQPQSIQPFLLAPLLSEASIHANTSGVFKGFHKNPDGLGQFGGAKHNALERILGPIGLPFPIFSNYECEVRVQRADANEVARTLGELDLAYLDPPYNQHPYGSNYFMLNLLADNQRPAKVSPVSGIPRDWQRSAYNKPQQALAALEDLVAKLSARCILISFNSEGFIKSEAMTAMLGRYGSYQVLERPYNAFRGSRNLRNRPIHTTEFLYLLEKR